MPNLNETLNWPPLNSNRNIPSKLKQTRSGIEDWNDTLNGWIAPNERTDHIAASKTKDGRARAHAIATDHGSYVSSEAGASAAALKDGNHEGLIADSHASAQFGLAGAAASAEAGVQGKFPRII